MSTPKPGVPNAMMEMLEQISPIFEAGAGLRVELERQGWSPTAAETIALETVRGIIRKAFQ